MKLIPFHENKFNVRYLLVLVPFMILALCLNFSPLHCQGTDQDSSQQEEYSIKSAYIYKICKFSVWPGMTDSEEPFVIAVLGELPEGVNFDIPEDKLIGKRKVITRKVTNIEDIAETEAVFICSSEEDNIELIVDFAMDKALLTFADTKGFGEKGVMFNFYMEDDFIKIEINRDYAEKSLVEFHSRLFTIGRIIE